MRRIILALMVAALMAVMLVATAGPTFAAGSVGQAGGGDCRSGCVNTNTIGGGDGPKKGSHKGGGIGEGPSVLAASPGTSIEI